MTYEDDLFSGSALSPQGETQGLDRSLLEAVAAMFSAPEFLFPLAAAQRQYREHYYGLSSAALLEDIYYDTFWNYLARFRPGTVLERPPRGERGWDYRFQGAPVSHKVGKGPQEMAALWDATRTDLKTWTFGFPVAFLCSGYSPSRLRIWNNTIDISATAVSGQPDQTVPPNRLVMILRWGNGPEAEIVHVTRSGPEGGELRSILPFESAWTVVAQELAGRVPANHLELVVTGQQDRKGLVESFLREPDVEVTAKFRPGLYVFPQEHLVDVPVKTNNRAVLLSRDTVAELMSTAMADGLFAPMPIWFGAYTGHRPPDLYLTQRAEFDSMFSPTRASPHLPYA
jgi:hypothetical protein